MSLSNENLLQWIAHIKYLYKNYASKIGDKYKYGTVCEEDDKKLLLSYFMLEEIKLYYLNCSCLTEETICNFIVQIQKYLNNG